MKIILHKLTIINFKGILEKTINFRENTNIFGANESGKSTIYTAFNWLLTGKDEFDRKDYEIKNTKKKELNSQAHEVEAILEIDGREEKLKRVYLEKWVKQKGQSQKTFEGHKTDFYWNDVPCSLSEYQAKVDSIIDSKIIKLVTNPTYFNSLKWDDQRRGLLGIAGVITNHDIFEAITTPDNDFASLINIINSGKTIDDYRKELSAKKLKLKKAATEFAPRIDEATRNMPEALDWKSIESKIFEINNEISGIDAVLENASLALAQRQKYVIEKQKTLHEKQSKLEKLRFEIKTDLRNRLSGFSGELQKLTNDIDSLSKRIDGYKKSQADNDSNISYHKKQIEQKNTIIAKLRSDWNIINAEQFSFDESACECPTCKQSLPPKEIENKRTQLLKNFNEDIAKRKGEKVTKSNQIKAEIAQHTSSIVEIEENSFISKIDLEVANLLALQHKFNQIKATQNKSASIDIEAETENTLSENTEAIDLKDRIATLQEEISKENASMDNTTETYAPKQRKLQLQKALDELKNQYAIKDTIDKTQLRINQLENEESANGQAIADIEQAEFDCDAYTHAKMNILENRVNGKFKYVRFRLFEEQINGAIVETCICEYNGVPYPTLNTAAKLLAGLDVLETLSNYYDVHAPVFCDNRESVTFIPDSESQIISLFVSPADKKIRVETESLIPETIS